MGRSNINDPIASVLPGSHWAVTLGVALCGLNAQAQLILDQSLPADTLVYSGFQGQGVAISNVTFNGGQNTLQFNSGSAGAFNGSNTCIGLDAGIFLSACDAQTGLPGPNDQLQQYSGLGGGAGAAPTPDLDLGQRSGWPLWQQNGGNNIFGKAVLEFDFVPDQDMVSFRYVFSSEQYERWVCDQYTDVFGFFISGPGISGPFTNNARNIALIPGSLRPVGINSVNSGIMGYSTANGPFNDPFAYCSSANPDWQADSVYYRNNGGQWATPQPMSSTPQMEAPYNTDPYYIQHNGLTVVLTASAAVQCGETYHAKLALGKANGPFYGSAIWLDQGSFSSAQRFSLSVEAGPNVDLSGSDPQLFQSSTDSVYLRFNRWGGFYEDEWLHIPTSGNAVPGVDYTPALPDSIHFNPLDSSVVVAIAVPVLGGGASELIANVVTCGGDNIQSFPLVLTGGTQSVPSFLSEGADALVTWPNPARDVLQVGLPRTLHGKAHLYLFDAMGRMVLEQSCNGATALLPVSGLPNGLYMVRAEAQGHVATSRIQVHH